jgi:hypothetical protein
VANASPAVTANTSSSFVLAQPYVTIRKVGRVATLKEVAKIRKAGDLELKGQIAYALWRQKHGDDLEEFVRRWMERGGLKLGASGAALDALRTTRARFASRCSSETTSIR